MLFNSYIFVFIFTPLTLGLYFLLARVGRRLSVAWVVLMSLVFYGWDNPVYLWLVAASLTGNYTFGVLLGGKVEGKARKPVLIAGLAMNLGFLGYFKYTNFFLDSFNYFFHSPLTLAHIALPLGISFFTFQQMAYLIDAYRLQTREYNFIDYCLFVCFFPQWVAGPIVHHKEVLPQFEDQRNYRLNSRHLAVGVTIFVIGLFKKVMIADNLSEYANLVFGKAAEGHVLALGESWLGALCYTFQLYFDFSGYSDMAIGLGNMFNIKLPINFNSPYKAANMIDFWRRWHITLSRFLRDYLYFALGGNRKGKVRRYVNLMLTMLLGGLWHGAGWTFVFWGGLHGLYLCVNHAWHALRRGLGLEPGKGGLAGVVLARALTFLAVMVAWVFFRAKTFDAATGVLSSMAGLHGFDLSALAKQSNLVIFALALLAYCHLAPNTQQFMARFKPAYEHVMDRERWRQDKRVAGRLRWSPHPLMAVALAALTVVTLLNMTRVHEFIYYHF